MQEEELVVERGLALCVRHRTPLYQNSSRHLLIVMGMHFHLSLQCPVTHLTVSRSIAAQSCFSPSAASLSCAVLLVQYSVSTYVPGLVYLLLALTLPLNPKQSSRKAALGA